MFVEERALVAALLVCVVGCSSTSGPVSNSSAGSSGNASSGAGNASSGGATSGGASSSGGSAGVASPSGGASNAAGSVGVAGASGALGSAGSSSGGAGGSGGANSAGGASVAGSSSGGSAAGSPCSARPGLLFCDDFEKAAVGAAPSTPWSTSYLSGSGGNNIAIDSSVPAHSGTKAVKIHPTDDAYQTLLVYHDPAILPQSNGRFFMRAFVRPDQAMTTQHNTLVLADVFATPDSGNVMRLGEDYNMLIMTVGGDAHGFNSNPPVEFPAQAYTCLEMLFDSPNQEIDVWVNGTEVPALHAMNLAHENYDSVRFGFEKYAGPVSDFWYDDIAIGTQQIGCN